MTASALQFADNVGATPGFYPAPATEELWYVLLAPGNVRPVTLDQLDAAYKAGFIGEATPVWSAGMANWALLGQVAGIETSARPTPPPRTVASYHAPAPGPYSARVQRRTPLPPPPRAATAYRPVPLAPPVRPSQPTPDLSLEVPPAFRRSRLVGLVLCAALVASTVIVFYRNDVLRSVARIFGQETSRLQVEERLTGPPNFGTPRDAESRISRATADLPHASAGSAERAEKEGTVSVPGAAQSVRKPEPDTARMAPSISAESLPRMGRGSRRDRELQKRAEFPKQRTESPKHKSPRMGSREARVLRKRVEAPKRQSFQNSRRDTKRPADKRKRSAPIVTERLSDSQPLARPAKAQPRPPEEDIRTRVRKMFEKKQAEAASRIAAAKTREPSPQQEKTAKIAEKPEPKPPSVDLSSRSKGSGNSFLDDAIRETIRKDAATRE